MTEEATAYEATAFPPALEIVRIFQGREIDFQMKHEDIRTRAGIPLGEEGALIYAKAMTEAQVYLRENFQMIVVNVRTEGYRVAHPREAPEIAKQYNRAGLRKMNRGLSILANADRSKLDATERANVDIRMANQANMLALLARHVPRVQRNKPWIPPLQPKRIAE